MNLDDPALFPVLEAARDLGASVFVHPWDMLGSNRMKDYWMPWLVGMPAETAVAICSIVMGGILDRLPGLKIAFAHGGGSFPFTLGRIAHGHDVRPDLCAHRTDRNPREYLDHFYLDSLVHDADALRFLVNQHGSHRIALGSDYPFPLGETQPGSLIRSMNDLTEVQQNQLLGGTALEFLGMTEAESSVIQAGDGRSSR
jgi:aminocarboxymuconate-semialdehyde decarboxylase